MRNCQISSFERFVASFPGFAIVTVEKHFPSPRPIFTKDIQLFGKPRIIDLTISIKDQEFLETASTSTYSCKCLLSESHHACHRHYHVHDLHRHDHHHQIIQCFWSHISVLPYHELPTRHIMSFPLSRPTLSSLLSQTASWNQIGASNRSAANMKPILSKTPVQL